MRSAIQVETLRRADPEGDRRARGALTPRVESAGQRPGEEPLRVPGETAPHREFGDSRREAGGLAQL